MKIKLVIRCFGMALIPIVLGMYCCSRSYPELYKWYYESACEEREAVVTSSRFRTALRRDPAGGTTPSKGGSVEFLYEYTVDGKTISGEEAGRGEFYSSEEAAAPDLQRYAAGQPISICILPDRPEYSWPKDLQKPTGLSGVELVVFLIGLFLILTGIAGGPYMYFEEAYRFQGSPSSPPSR